MGSLILAATMNVVVVKSPFCVETTTASVAIILVAIVEYQYQFTEFPVIVQAYGHDMAVDGASVVSLEEGFVQAVVDHVIKKFCCVNQRSNFRRHPVAYR